MNLTLIIPPASEPIAIGAVELQTRNVDLTAEADVVDLIIGSVRERAEFDNSSMGTYP